MEKRPIFYVLILQTVFLILFIVFVRYDQHGFDSINYTMFQDVHIMLFIGFGYLMAFLRKYGYSSVGFNFLVAAITVQWAILCLGFLNMDKGNKIHINLSSIYEAEIASAAVLISMGAVLGRASYIQLILMGVLEIALYVGNLYFGQNILQITDAGDSIFVHTYGAYFGLAVSFCLTNNKDELTWPSSQYISDLFALIGTIFLWAFWPSFNAICLTGEEQQRAIVNTYFSLTASCVTAFAISAMITSDHKFDMVHIQNSTLAGGVAIGASANLILQPYGALAVGIVAGLISAYGYKILSPWIEEKLKIQDTCGVHNLHGLPGIFSGLVSMLMAGIATKDVYYEDLGHIFPSRVETTEKFGLGLETKNTNTHGARSAGMQAVFQGVAVITTVFVAVLSGLITGKLIVMDNTMVVTKPNVDTEFWQLPDDIEDNQENDTTKQPVSIYLQSSC